MNYQEAVGFLNSRLPMFHRVGAAAYKADLTRTISLLTYLGNPEKMFTSVHIAGTNGKGSVSHMIASVLQEAGYKTGLFTSPHLTDYRERIKINGQEIPEAYVASFVEKYKDLTEDVQPSFFEYTTGMAFAYFAEEQVDIAVIETGLGGRLDSTNVIAPEVSVITNIGWDHMQFLGETLDKIAV
jgi:dihydrofolate synthase / folylpolyglutamate synthase